MTRKERSEINKALFQQRLDCWLAEFHVTDEELMAYILPRVPADSLFDADVMKREVRRFAVEMGRRVTA